MKQYFRSGPPQKKLNVDVESRSLLNVVAIQKGDIKDPRPWAIDEEFMNDLVSFASSQKDGVMVNYDHNWNPLGRRLGRATNWRVEKTQVKCDIQLYESANKSPGMEGMADYVMSMATEDDKAIMLSISFDINHFYQRDSAGKQVKVWYYDEEFNWVRENPKMGKVYPKMKALNSVDVVGEGAATDALFSKDEKLVVLSRMMADDDMISLLSEHADEFPALNQLFDKKAGRKSFFEKLKSLLSVDAGETTTPIISQQKSESMSEITQEAFDALKAENDQLKATNQELSKKVEDLTSDKKTSEDQFASLSAKFDTMATKMEELAASAGAHTSGGPDEEEEEDTKDVPLYMKNPIYQKAQSIHQGLKKSK